MFVHRVMLPTTSSLLRPRKPLLSPSISDVDDVVKEIHEDISHEENQPLPEPIKDEVDIVESKGEKVIDVTPYLVAEDRSSVYTTTSTMSWDTAGEDDIEIVCARDSYSAQRRLSDLCKLEQILVPPPRIRARTLSWSPNASLQETTLSVASNILRRRSDVSLPASEHALVNVLDKFVETMKRVYDERCLKVVPRRHIESDLETMLQDIDVAKENMDHEDAALVECAEEMTSMIHQVLEDVHGLHHLGSQGEIEYVKL